MNRNFQKNDTDLESHFFDLRGGERKKVYFEVKKLFKLIERKI